MTEASQPTIRDFMKAGYPALFLPTAEAEVAEHRVLQAITELNLGRDIRVGIWKATNGMVQGRYQAGMTLDAFRPTLQTRERQLQEALGSIKDATEDDPVVLICHNIRALLNNFQVVQQLIDSIMMARLTGSHIILVGPVLDLPPELKSLVTYCDCPLPTQDQISGDYRRLLRAYKSQIDDLPKGEQFDELVRHAANAALGLDSMGAENALSLSLATMGGVDLSVIQSQKEQEVRKSDVLEFIPIAETMDEVGGFEAYKTWLQRRERVFTDEAREYGLPYPKGVLIVGPAGTGKSLAAKATAAYLKLPLLRLDMGKIFRSLVGESEAAIRMALKVTEAVSPVVLWLDELDKGFAGMRGSGTLDSGVTSRVVSTILTWRQETTSPVMFVATANEVMSIPPMVYRKGRLDEVWATDLPTQNERGDIFKIHIRKRGRDPEKFDCEALAKMSEDMVGAEIEGCFEDAMFSAFDENEEVNTHHVIDSIMSTIPQAQRSREEITATQNWVKERARLVSGKDQDEMTEHKGRLLKLQK